VVNWRYLSLPPWANVVKLFSVVIDCPSMVITKVVWVYNTEWWHYHGITVNFLGKKFYNIGPGEKVSIYVGGNMILLLAIPLN
jgi:hypothetical protein